MISREHYRDGLNLNPQQQIYQQQFAREGSAQVRQGIIDRPFVSLAVLPDNTAANRERYGNTDLKKSSLVAASRVEFATMVDVVSSHQSPIKRIDTLVLFQHMMIDKDGTPFIGGLSEGCRLKIDFARGPLTPAQSSVTCRRLGRLKSPVSGPGIVKRHGDCVDICVGTFRRGSHSFSRVIWRLFASDFEDGRAELAFGNVPTESGEEVPLGPVEANQTLVELHETTEFKQARLNDRGEPITDRPRGRVLMATKTEYFAALNAMNRAHNDLVLLDKPPALVDPNTWAFRVLYEVPEMQFDDGTTFDPRNLLSFPEATITPALVGDLLRSVAVGGDLFAISDHTGEVANVLANEVEPVTVIFSDGHVMRFPAVAKLHVDGEALCAGMVLNVDQKIGDMVPRADYRDLDVLAAAADGLELLLAAFLRQHSIYEGKNGWAGNSVLYDWSHIPPALLEHLPAVTKRTGIYLDLSAGARYYVREAHGYVYPPMPVPATDTIVNVGRLSIDFAEPVYIPPKQPTHKAQQHHHEEVAIA